MKKRQWIIRPPDMIPSLHAIAKHVGLNPKSVMAEIGSFTGQSAEVWAMYGCHVHCVDPFTVVPYKDGAWMGFDDEQWLDIERQFDERAGVFPGVFKWKSKSTEAAIAFSRDPHVFGLFDFTYIDALHDYQSVKQDLDLWLPLTRHWIGGHDYGDPDYPGVKQAVDEKFGAENVATFKDTSWLVKL